MNGIPCLPALPCVSCFVAVVGLHSFVYCSYIKAFDYCCGFRVLLSPPPFFVRAFCMRMLNCIHDEIVNRSFACWLYFDCLKSTYKPTVQKVCTRVTVGKRFAVCSGAKNICIALARHRNYRQVFKLRSRYRRKTKTAYHQRNTSVLLFRRKNTAIFWFTASANVVTAEK